MLFAKQGGGLDDHNLRYAVLVRESLGGNVDDNIPVAIVLS